MERIDEGKMLREMKEVYSGKEKINEEKIEKYGVGDIDIYGNEVEAVYSYKDGNKDWQWDDKKGNVHLVRDGEELTKGIEAIWIDSYANGDWRWQDREFNWHLMRDGKEVKKDGAEVGDDYSGLDWVNVKKGMKADDVKKIEKFMDGVTRLGYYISWEIDPDFHKMADDLVDALNIKNKRRAKEEILDIIGKEHIDLNEPREGDLSDDPEEDEEFRKKHKEMVIDLDNMIDDVLYGRPLFSKKA
jgi:hypothetical protein